MNHATKAFNVQEVFGGYPLAQFIEEHFHRLPFALPESAKSLQSLGSWEALGELLHAPDLDILVAQDGAQCSRSRPSDLASARSLSSDGCTVVIRNGERHCPALRDVAEAFTETFHGPTDVQMFFTPAGRPGFSWHYDAEDVFIVQTSGEKEYLLRKNTVNPWPLLETLPDDMRYEQEIMPLSRVWLRPGDLLYIPCGYWHRAQAKAGSDETSISLAIGVMSPAAIDVLDIVRPCLRESLPWRQRLPLGSDGDARQRLSLLLSQLADDFARHLRDPKFAESVVRKLTNPPGRRKEQ